MCAVIQINKGNNPYYKKEDITICGYFGLPPGGFNKYFNRCFIIPPFTQTIGRSDTERVIAWAKIGIGYTTVIICDSPVFVKVLQFIRIFIIKSL